MGVRIQIKSRRGILLLLVGSICIAGLISFFAQKQLNVVAVSNMGLLPARLIIPQIHIAAPLEQVGLTSEGRIGTPKEPANAAWFNLSPLPGVTGTAVIDGHYGWKNNTPAVFDDLSALRPGDKIQVQNGNGVTVTFAVRELRTYGENENTSGLFNTNDGKAHLVLITCKGTWDKLQKSYSDRLVVISDLAAEKKLK